LLYYIFSAVFVGLLCVLSAQAADWSNICAFEIDGARLPLPMDCKRFVLCADREIAQIRSCPRGLHFNPKLGECDFQWRADCSGLSLYANTEADEDCVCTCCEEECQASEIGDTTTPCAPEQETTSSAETDTTDDGSSDSTFDDGETTNAPITGSTTPRPSTASTTTSKPSTGSTTTARPSTGSTTTSSPTGTEIVPQYCSDKRSNCANQPDGALIPVDGVCTSYIQCSHGCCYEQLCPGGLYFNDVTGLCDFFWNVECEPDTNQDANGEIVGPSGTSCSDQGVCAGKRDGRMFAIPDSNGYVVCQCQCPIAMACDPKLTFNETAQVCDWDRTAASVTVDCPDGLVYNATSDQCDYPEGYVPEVVCDNDATVCQGKEEGALFPIEGVCNMFYKCNFNCAVEQSCPNNLIYDQVHQLCDYPQNVKCEWPYTPPSGPNAGPSGISCETNGRCLGQREGTFFPSLTSCSGYAVCQCECEVEMQCKNGLYWDQSLKTCNYPDKVECTL
ncbi:hypothetical protein KR044_006993, partial [Drosophila immigrans]